MSFRMPHTVPSILTALAIALAACGGEESTPAVATDKTGASSSTGSETKATTNQTEPTTKVAAGTKKFAGAVCSLLTPAEVEAVAKTGQTLTPLESGPDPDVDRSCAYMQGTVAPIVLLTLQGELEPVDWPATKGLPGTKTVPVRGAEATFWPTTNVLYVYKNGLSVVIQAVVPPAGETYESAETKLAQPVADRLP